MAKCTKSMVHICAEFSDNFFWKVLTYLQKYAIIGIEKVKDRPKNQKGYIMEIKVKIYNGCKYLNTTKTIHTRVYSDVKYFKVETLTHEEIARMGYDEYDEFNEYITIAHQNGETEFHMNSHVDVFKV